MASWYTFLFIDKVKMVLRFSKFKPQCANKQNIHELSKKEHCCLNFCYHSYSWLVIILLRLSSKQQRLPVKYCTFNNYLESMSLFLLISDTLMHIHCFQSIVFILHRVRHSSQIVRKFLCKIIGSHVHPCSTIILFCTFLPLM